MFSTTAGFWRYIAVVGRWDQQSPLHPLFSPIFHTIIIYPSVCIFPSVLSFPVCPSYDYYAPAQQLGLYRPMPHPWPNVAHHLHPRIISMCVAYPQKGRGCIYVHDAIVLYRDTLHYNLLQLLQYIYSYYTSTPPAHLICIETRQRFFSRQGRFSPPPVKCQMMLRDCHPENKCDKR
jgi:hypothetical protein